MRLRLPRHHPRWRGYDRSPRGSSSVGRASASQAEGREFEPRLPLLPGTPIPNSRNGPNVHASRAQAQSTQPAPDHAEPWSALHHSVRNESVASLTSTPLVFEHPRLPRAQDPPSKTTALDAPAVNRNADVHRLRDVFRNQLPSKRRRVSLLHHETNLRSRVDAYRTTRCASAIGVVTLF